MCDEYVCVCGWVFNGTIQVFILFSYLELFKGIYSRLFARSVSALVVSAVCTG